MVTLFSHVSEEPDNTDPDDIARIIEFGSHNLGRLDLIKENSGFYFSTNSSGVAAQGSVAVRTGRKAYLRIDREGVTDLSGLANLRPDDLDSVTFECSPDDFQLRFLPALSQLPSISFQEIEISEFGLAFIGLMKNLQFLNLGGSGIDDRAVAKLSAMNLQTIYLNRTRVTDAGLAAFAKMKSLQSIELPPATTDAGLEHFAELKLLKIYAKETNCTPEGLNSMLSRGISREVLMY